MTPEELENNRARDEQMQFLRIRRNATLNGCDWTQLPDTALTADQKAAWASYRQQLRDWPETITDPFAPSWPTPPSQ